MGKGHLSLGKTILTVEPGKGGEGSFVSRKTVEPGRGGEGYFVSRNNDSKCRTREKEGGGHLSLGTIILKGRGHLSIGTMFVTVEPRRAGRGHLSLGTIILGWGGGHLSLGTIILFQVHRERGRGGVMGVICL